MFKNNRKIYILSYCNREDQCEEIRANNSTLIGEKAILEMYEYRLFI